MLILQSIASVGHLKVGWSTSVTCMALLACVGVDEEGFIAEEVERYVAALQEFAPLRPAGPRAFVPLTADQPVGSYLDERCNGRHPR